MKEEFCKLKQVIISAFIVAIILSLVTPTSSISILEVDRETDHIDRPTSMMNMFCSVYICGIGDVSPSFADSQFLLFVDWATANSPAPKIRITGLNFLNNINEDNARSTGDLTLFIGSIDYLDNNQFQIKGFAFKAVYFVGE